MKSVNPFDNVEIAAQYDSWYHAQGKQAAHQEKRLLSNLINQFPEAHKVLEIGCGTGYFTYWLDELSLDPIGVDQSRIMIRQTQTSRNLICVQGDAQALPFAMKSFDLTLFITTLEFILDPKQALQEAARVSRQGMVLGVINKHSLLGWRYRRKGGTIWGNAHLYTLRELKNLLSRSLSRSFEMKFKTTLWPIFSGASKLPWGGFFGLAVHFKT
jgi:ubiquinone/menaquinone biosynthesis C-methylase UbiE